MLWAVARSVRPEKSGSDGSEEFRSDDGGRYKGHKNKILDPPQSQQGIAAQARYSVVRGPPKPGVQSPARTEKCDSTKSPQPTRNVRKR
jgi:hypothetical protein